MKRQIMFGTVFAAALAVGASAQTGSGSQSPTQSDPSKKEITVTGCLTSGGDTKGTSGSTAGSAAGSMAGEKADKGFVLTNATVGTAGAGAASSTGTSGSAAGAATSPLPSYKLTGGQSESLDRYLNHKVEVRGTVDDSMGMGMSSGAGSGSAAGSATGSATGAAMQHEKMQNLRVVSVRDLGTSCTGGGL